MLVFPHHRAIIVSWKYSSAGMSVRLTRERSWVRAPLLPFFVPFFSLRFHFIFLSSPKACFFQPPDFSLAALFVSAALSGGVGIINFKIFLIIYSKNIQTFRRIACYTKYIRNARMFNNYPSTLFENPKILKKIAPYHLVRSFFYVFHMSDFLYLRYLSAIPISGSALPGPSSISPHFHRQNNIRPYRSGALPQC